MIVFPTGEKSWKRQTLQLGHYATWWSRWQHILRTPWSCEWYKCQPALAVV